MYIEGVGFIHDALLGGTRPMTNAEYIQNCEEEELPNVLWNIIEKYYSEALAHPYMNLHDDDFNDFKKWLKEEYKDDETYQG